MEDITVQPSGGAGIASDGGVLIWGTEEGDEFADGELATSVAPGVPKLIPRLPPMRAVSSYGGVVIAIDRVGTSWWWGKTKWNGMWLGQPTPTAIPGMPALESAVSLGNALCGLTENGDLWCWGENRDGRLGMDTPAYLAAPARVDGLPALQAVAIGEDASCGLGKDRAVYCWGNNSQGLIGTGTADDTIYHPTRVVGVDEVRELALKSSTACAVTQEDELLCWGANAEQIISTSQGIVPTPVLVDAHVRSAALGSGHLCVLRSDNSVWCRGNPIAVGWDLSGATTTKEFRQVLLP